MKPMANGRMATRVIQHVEPEAQRDPMRRHSLWLPTALAFGALACVLGALLTAIDPRTTPPRSAHRTPAHVAHAAPAATTRPNVLTITGSVLQFDESASSLDVRSGGTVYTIHTNAGTVYAASCVALGALSVGKQVTVLINAYLNGSITAHSIAPADGHCGVRGPHGNPIAPPRQITQPDTGTVPAQRHGIAAAQADSPPRP